jgi:hypothetical protein
MANALGHDKALTWCELDRFVFEVDQEFSIEHKKEFIDIVMLVPVIFAFEHADSDYRIVHFAKGLVIPLVFARLCQFLNVDDFERSVQNVQISLVRKIVRGPFHGHDVDFNTNLGSARASRAGDCALAIATFFCFLK